MLAVSLSRAEFERRAAEAYELLGERCVVCPRGCKVDRRADVAGLCAIGRPVVASHFPHFGEKDCLRGRRGGDDLLLGLQPPLRLLPEPRHLLGCPGRARQSRAARR